MIGEINYIYYIYIIYLSSTLVVNKNLNYKISVHNLSSTHVCIKLSLVSIYLIFTLS